MMVTSDPLYLQATLSSKLFEYAYKKIFSSVELGKDGYQYNKHALVKLPVRRDHAVKEDYDDRYFYSLYNLSIEEAEFIERNTNH